MKIKFQNSGERGSVFTELALVMPILFFVMSGLLSVGQTLSQISWLAQSAYQVALVGSEQNDSVAAIGAMQARSDLLVQNNRASSSVFGQTQSATVTPSYDSVNGIVKVEYTAGLINIWGGALPIPLKLSIAGPILANATTSPGSLGQPENTGYFNCSGVRIAAPSTTPCYSGCSASACS